ncbi:hypothetical protein ASE60_21220 [Ensifer sp. Root278]|nr:hypothetical protein ASE60_21220 [Ensifer sp. Root278]
MTPRDLLAWNVRKLRVKRGLSQERLAQIATVLECKVFELFVEPKVGEGAPSNLPRGRKP